MKALSTYVNSDGVTVTVYAMAKPRPSEKTWVGNSKYSIYQMGHQATATGSRGARTSVDNVKTGVKGFA